MWIYSFIRTDLSIAQQIVQTAHSAYESGRGLGKHVPFPRMVLIAVSDGDAMKEALDYASGHLECYPFYESELGLCNKLTSFTTRPVKYEERGIFKHFKLWRQPK